MQPLAGITVVSLEQAIAAPLATRHLADLGARVIKIERPDQGDFARHLDTTVQGMSSHFVWANRSKESLTLNLKHLKGKGVLEELLAQADVFIQNLAPGAVERLGFASAQLRQRWPKLIICNISGYGPSGPYRNKKAYDLLVQAETGVVSITGTEDTPSKSGIPVADIAAGLYAYSGVLTALLSRIKSGQGTVVEVSLFEALGEWMGFPAYYTAYGGAPPPRTGSSHAAITPYGLFPTGDGKTLLFSIQNEREWGRLCDIVLQQPELADNPRFATNSARTAHKAALHAIIDDIFLKLSLTEIVERFETAAIAYAQMRSVQEFWEHPQLAARRRWREVASPVGPLQALMPPVTLAGIEPVMGPIPAVGEHTDPILTELGYTSDQVKDLREQAVV